MPIDKHLIEERLDGFAIEAGDIEAIRAISALEEWHKTVDFEQIAASGDLRAAVDACDRIIEAMDGVLGAGAVQRIFEGGRVTIAELGYAFVRMSELMKQASDGLADEVAAYTETVPED